MAGLIRALFGGRERPPDPDPLPGISGYRLPTGRAGESGFPGSTHQTRTFPGNNPRLAQIRSDTNTGWENGLGTTQIEQQASFRGDVPESNIRNPRATSKVRTPKTRIRELMQDNSPAEFYGGPRLRTGSGSRTTGGNPLSPAAHEGGHSLMDTQTPAKYRRPTISGGVPGSQNVRNQIAQRYKEVPGRIRAYKSAPRGDLPPTNKGGQATDGNVHPERAVTMVTVPSRYVYDAGGYMTYYMLRRMPYVGRGDGARGADLNGQRYYATGQEDQFGNSGAGNYGIARELGGDHKRPVSFQEPAPWTQNYYDTTDSVGTTNDPGSGGQAPNMVYISPSTGRATNGTGRRG